MKLLTKAGSIFDRTNGILAVITALLIIFIMLGVVANVTTRSLLNRSIWGLFELTEYGLLYITFIGATWVLQKEGHVRMDLVLCKLKPGTQAVMNIITSTIGAMMCFLITWYGVEVVWRNIQSAEYYSTELQPPRFLILLIIPLGTFLLSIQFLRKIYGYLGMWRASPDKEVESQINP